MRTFFALCLAAVAVSGCGSTPQDSAEEFKGEEQKVAATVERLESAARDNEAASVCKALLADTLLTTLKKQGTNCTTAVKDAIADADNFDLTVDDVTVSGAEATARVVSGKGSEEKSDTLELARDGSDWKIVSLRAAS